MTLSPDSSPLEPSPPRHTSLVEDFFVQRSQRTPIPPPLRYPRVSKSASAPTAAVRQGPSKHTSVFHNQEFWDQVEEFFGISLCFFAGFSLLFLLSPIGILDRRLGSLERQTEAKYFLEPWCLPLTWRFLRASGTLSTHHLKSSRKSRDPFLKTCFSRFESPCFPGSVYNSENRPREEGATPLFRIPPSRFPLLFLSRHLDRR